MSLHKTPDAGTGERISVQHVPHTGPQVRSGPATQPHRKAGQDLVPEPQDENEEDQQGPSKRRVSLWGARLKKKESKLERKRKDCLSPFLSPLPNPASTTRTKGL